MHKFRKTPQNHQNHHGIFLYFPFVTVMEICDFLLLIGFYVLWVLLTQPNLSIVHARDVLTTWKPSLKFLAMECQLKQWNQWNINFAYSIAKNLSMFHLPNNVFFRSLYCWSKLWMFGWPSLSLVPWRSMVSTKHASFQKFHTNKYNNTPPK